MLASRMGHSPVVRILLDKGANTSKVGERLLSALHLSAREGHIAVCKMLVNAGAPLEAATAQCNTPLHMASEQGHLGVMSVLIKAGANPNSRRPDGTTPFFLAAQGGHTSAIKMLLRAKANPLSTRTIPELGKVVVPLDVAIDNGHLEVVRELVQQVGIERCGGASGGVEALAMAAMDQRVDIMAVLTGAGVVDTGRALAAAAGHGREASVKLLLQQKKGDKAAYVNYRDDDSNTPLLFALGFGGYPSPSPRIVRLLVDAGVDTSSVARFTNIEGEVVFDGTPLTCTTMMLRERIVPGEDATEEQLHKVEGIHRLLLRVEAVHAVSLLWPVDIPSMVGTAEGTSRKVANSTPLRMMLPILRRRARRPRVLLAALFRRVV